ncbi:MAG: 3-dehydroquinate synthase [Gemmatimonadaceae bacterium]
MSSGALSRSVSAGSYDITIAPGALSDAAAIIRHAAPAHRYAIVTDSNVGLLYAEALRRQFEGDSAAVCTIPAGEAHKTRDSWASVTDQLLDRCFGRDSTVVALGGGVVCDLAGFVAATFMRGVPVVHLPTTLLAMIDASIGGKTGVDTPSGKNLVGAFHLPSAVVIDPEVLATLPLPELRSGFAEAIKHGVIADERYFDFLAEVGPELAADAGGIRDVSVLGRVIEESVRIKAAVVLADEREKGARKTLNFGHTVGHAIELLSGFTMRHGEAVGVGMVLEARAGERAGITQAGTVSRIATALERAGLPTERPAGPSPERIMDLMRGDKKARSGAAEYAVPARVGMMAAQESGYAVRLPDALMCEVLA